MRVWGGMGTRKEAINHTDKKTLEKPSSFSKVLAISQGLESV